MISKNFSFNGWKKAKWLLGRKKMVITFIGMFCTWLAFDTELTGLLVGGAIFEGVWSALEYFVKRVEY